MKKNQKMIIAAVAIAAIFFFSGWFIGRMGGMAQRPQGMASRTATGSFNRTSASRGSMIAGDILSKSDNSLTIKLRSGGSQIIFFSDKTEVGKAVTGTLADLIAGASVTASGQTNSDGSLTASMIQIRPAGSSSTPGNFGGPGGQSVPPAGVSQK